MSRYSPGRMMRAFDWLAYQLVMHVIPRSWRLWMWLLPYAGRYAFTDNNTLNTGG